MAAAYSQAEQAALDPRWRDCISGLSEIDARVLEKHWPWWRRPDQTPPSGEWRAWLVMAGRGFGKTRMGAEWVRAQAERNPKLRIALVGATQEDVRRVMIEGESGLLAVAGWQRRPSWEPSIGRLKWPGGAQAEVFAASEPDKLRGPQHHIAWADEIGKWANGEDTWDNLLMSLRMGKAQVVATTTPRPVALVRRLVADASVIKTCGATMVNRANLARGFFDAMGIYAGTRLGRQELHGELLDDVPDALWTRDMVERARIGAAPELVRVVIGVDPPASAGGDACGIVAVGLGRDRRGYVLEDASVHGASPEGWARAVAACAARHRAERVVAEKNQGGDMVASVLRGADSGLPVTLVHATRGKVSRAEPVALLYEAGRAWHVGGFSALEDELCGLQAGGGYEGPGRSPDRADALVWAMTELMLGKRGAARVTLL
ncbi:phage terminase large subunit-like protein [Sphingomonas naasensis]|uniref:ATP-binding protein n=1 Tax=Sphingomonas naasensis TaxID=1344951 RepID=A0A4S1WID9_9SPHN|nr:terminase family protein [Sphingomonas naasensis]NIJ21614.1 phage terminase large subunit-like protein [Sphingomonas naasensis]TGX41450.1 ATP-binding protein [Sphingomonas naasensis]